MKQTEKVCEMVRKAKRFAAPIDLVVLPEYMLHGSSMDMSDEIMCEIDGPEVAELKKVCKENDIWGCFSIMEYNPNGNPFNTGLIIDNYGKIKLNCRKLHPWVPVEPWEPGDQGLPVCEEPNGSTLGLAICHDGMFPEVSRELVYKVADIILRTAGYTRPILHSWRITNQANTFCDLAYTASVAMCGSDGTNDSIGEGMILGFDGVPLVEGSNRPDEIITGEVRPDLAYEARTNWALENNIYQLGHRGFVAVQNGINDAPYTYMRDLQNGTYCLPLKDHIVYKDGQAYGFKQPRAKY